MMKLTQSQLRPIVEMIRGREASKRLIEFQSRQPYPLSLQNLCENANINGRVEWFKFMKVELPTRLAQIMSESELLPRGLKESVTCNVVRENLASTFSDLLLYEAVDYVNDDILNSFEDSLQQYKDLHLDTIPLMAEAVNDFNGHHRASLKDQQNIQFFLERLYLTRMGITNLINQYLSMGSPSRSLGFLDEHCNVVKTLTEAYEDARRIVERHYERVPSIEFNIISSNPEKDVPKVVSFVYFPDYLFYVAFELLKNSMRATCEKYKQSTDLPQVKVSLCFSEDNYLRINITDLGDGIPADVMNKKLFQFGYSSNPVSNVDNCGNTVSPMAGLGYGLALSRLYTRYLNGNLVLSSAQGKGTTSSIVYPLSPALAVERVPKFTKKIVRFYQKGPVEQPFDGLSVWTTFPLVKKE